jgi:hypothetical protein
MPEALPGRGARGISTGVIAGIAAGGAAVGVGVLAANGGNSTTTTTPASPPPPPTTTVAPTTSVPAVQSIKACFQLDPPNGVIHENEALKVDGRCSQGGDSLHFHYDLGDGRTKDGQAFITPVWQAAGTYTLTLTVSLPGSSLRSGQGADEDSYSSPITVLRAAEPVIASFTATPKPDSCFVEFDGSPSSGDINRYQWALDVNNDMGGGVIRLEGKRVSHDFRPCSSNALIARLTVTGTGGDTDSIEKRVVLFATLKLTGDRAANGSVEGSVATAMLDSKGARGQLVLGDGQSYPVASETPITLRFSAKKGRNELEAVMASDTPALWRLDFSGARGFVPGSLRTLAGQEVSRDQYSLVLRFSGQAGERARIEYRLEP